MRKVSQLVKENENIKTLSIGFDISSKDEVDNIFAIIEKSNITDLRISHKCSNKEVSAYFGEKLRNNRTLTSIAKRNWDDIMAKDVISAISHNPRINTLVDIGRVLSCASLKNIAELLIETKTLKTLDMQARMFENNAVESGFFTALSENTSLTNISLKFRGAGENSDLPTGKYLTALKGNKYLKEKITISVDGDETFPEYQKEIDNHIAQNVAREGKLYNIGLKEFVDSIFQEDQISSRSKIKIDATKEKLSALLCDKLQAIIDKTDNPNSEYIRDLINPDNKITDDQKKKLSHSIIDGLSQLKIEGAKFKYQPIRKITDILNKIVEFVYGLIMYPKDGGKELDKCLKNHTELVITDHAKFAVSLNNLANPTKPIDTAAKPKSIDDVLDSVFTEARAKGKWTSKVQQSVHNSGRTM